MQRMLFASLAFAGLCLQSCGETSGRQGAVEPQGGDGLGPETAPPPLAALGPRGRQASDPDLGSKCGGRPITLPAPGIPEGAEVAVLFSPCGIVAGGRVARGQVTVSVPTTAVTGAVWVRPLNDQTFRGAFDHCLAAGESLRTLQSNGACAGIDVGGALDRTQRLRCAQLRATPVFADRLVTDLLSRSRCQLRCEALEDRAGWLTIEQVPTVRFALDDLSEVTTSSELDAEMGAHRIHWRTDSSASVTDVTLNVAGIETPGQRTGDRSIQVADRDVPITITARNRCGPAELAITLRPMTTVSSVDNAYVSVRNNTPARVRFSTKGGVAGPLVAQLAVDSSSFTLSPATVSLVPDASTGGLSGFTSITYDPRRGPPIGHLSVRMSPSMNGSVAIRDPGLLTLVGTATSAVGLTPHITVTGSVHAGPHAVRGARIDIRDSTGAVIATATTDDAGNYSAPAFSDTPTVVARVCAVAPHAQVNLENDATEQGYRCIDSAPAVVTGPSVPVSFAITATNDVTTFRVFDTVVRADRYVRSVNPAILEGYVRVIPCSSCYGAALKTRDRRVTDIWLPWNRLSEPAGHTVRHEFGHHVENLLGTWLAWAAVHDGCYVGPTIHPAPCSATPAATDLDAVASGSQNDAVYAMFEGFPTFLSNAIERDAGLPTQGFSYRPGGACACPIIGRNGVNSRPIQPDGVEHYVAGILQAIVLSPPRTAAGYIDRHGHAIVDTNGNGADDEAQRVIVGDMLDILGHMPYPTYQGFKPRFIGLYPSYEADLEAIESGFGL